MSYDGCLEDKREYYQNCSLLYCWSYCEQECQQRKTESGISNTSSCAAAQAVMLSNWWITDAAASVAAAAAVDDVNDDDL